MAIFNWLPQMPFTDFHQLNLDWIVETVKEWSERLNAFFDEDGAKALVEDVLEEHPEWVTTVEDGAITKAKINAAFLPEIENAYVTPEMFGAVGDGVADDTAAVQEAVNAGRDNNKAVYLSNVYSISEPIKVYGVRNAAMDRGSVVFGNKKAELKAAQTMPAVIRLEPKSTSTAYGVTLKGFNLDGDNKAERGLYANISASECVFSDITVKNCENAVEFASNCYLNSFTNIRTYHCPSYGFYLHNGANTANVFTKCYVDSSAIAYRLTGIYSTLISCCADNTTDTVFYFSSFRGSMVGCGTESNSFNAMIFIDRYSNVNISGGMFYGNPDLTGSYITVELGSNLTVSGCTMNYHTGEQAAGRFIEAKGSNNINVQNVQIYVPFPNADIIASSSRVIQPGANIVEEKSTITVDANGVYTTTWSGSSRTILSVSTSRSGWVLIPFLEGNVWKIKSAGQAGYTPNMSDPVFQVSIRYVLNGTI